MIPMVFPTYNAATFSKAVDCIQSALHGTVKPHSITVIDNSGGEFALYYRGHDKNRLNNLPQIEIVSLSRNVGLTGCWNYAYDRFITKEGHPALLLPGDDCVFHEHTLEKMLDVLNSNYEAQIIYPARITDPEDKTMSPWSFFIQRAHLFHNVGLYDEEFPVYYADNDYAWRMKLRGYEPNKSIVGVDVTAGHWGSAHVKAAVGEYRKEHDAAVTRNMEYYKRKWGGLPGSESYNKPFNRTDA